jgi:uncharacterized RDD family membrane protein YckC
MAEARIITSQYVQIDQTPAGVGERIFARIIDYFILLLYSIAVLYFIGTDLFRYFRGDYIEWLIFLLYVPVIFYSLLCETFNRGQTLGKKALGMRVVMRDGASPTLGVCFLRWLFLIIDVWMSCIGLFVMLLNRNNQRLGDLAAGSMVIKERDYHRIHVSLDEYNYLRKGYVPNYPQAFDLTLEQVNIITEALSRYDENRSRRIAALAAKVKEHLKMSSSDNDEAFLATLVRDFQYYAIEEV